MVNVFSLYQPLFHGLLKRATGLEPKPLEIEPGTVLNIWAPRKADPNKPSVVFLHGFAADGILNWQFQVLALFSYYNVYVPDFLFFGGSVTGREERTAEFQAEVVAKGLTKLGVERCVLVGLSYGGMVGFKMAEMYPDLVESMVVSCSVMALTESVSAAAQRRIGCRSWPEFLLPESTSGVKAMFEKGLYRLPKLPGFIYKHYLEAMFAHRKEKTELLKALVIRDEEFTDHHYSQRIHLLWGENDMIFNMETAQNLKEKLGEKASLDYIEKAGHLVNLERPREYNKHLKRILASLVQKYQLINYSQ